MQAWYNELSKPERPLYNKNFVVTGYSLGGHLATAFPMLFRGASADGVVPPVYGVSAVYTFNGWRLS